MSDGGKSPKSSSKSGRNVNRGTQNELEIIGLIVLQSPALRQLVHEKMRQARKRQADKEKGTLSVVSSGN